jgi:hypothetical protein
MAKYETKFFVLNFKHLADLSDEAREKVEDAMQCVSDELIEHNYYVCNQDEPYAQSVINTILAGEGLKEAKKERGEAVNATSTNKPQPGNSLYTELGLVISSACDTEDIYNDIMKRVNEVLTNFGLA